MNILLLGSGGREHALAWKIANSPLVSRLFCAPGNPGVAQEAELTPLNLDDHPAIVAFCRANAIELVVIGPEAPLVAGLVDDLETAGIRAFGPSKAAAQLEGSKAFTKDLCRDHGIPTAHYGRFTSAESATAYVRERGAPIVVKADGLAAGKGVTVATNLPQAEQAIAELFAGPQPASEIVVEDYLEGEEISFFVLCDGTRAIPLASAQDHKRAFDGDQGPNTGGMGAYSPAPSFTADLSRQVMREIIEPTLLAMRSMGAPYKGVLYAGLMLTHSGPQLIEYNVRFGDPECQVLMLRLMSDIVPALLAVCDGALDAFDLRWYPDPAVTVVMAAKGYPGAYARGTKIAGLDEAAETDGVQIFHAGTALKNGALVANGGRVLNICATGPTVSSAQTKAYAAIERIRWPEGFCRRDIAWRAIARESSLREDG